MDLKIKHIQHVGIPVTEMEASIAFYQRLGFSCVMAGDFFSGGGKGKGIVVMMQLNNIVIELYLVPDMELIEIKSRGNGRIDHIAFDVEDIDHTFSLLKNACFTIIENEPVYLPFWKNGCRYFNVTGPNGERLEFNQVL